MFKKHIDKSPEFDKIILIIIIHIIGDISMLKRSKQREAILKELCSRCDHPTADELYTQLRKEMPSISLGTVYRNLALLNNEGLIRKLTCGTADHFDGDPKPHYHFCCNQCGRVYDLDMQVHSELEAEAAEHTDFMIESHSLIFYGKCRNCNLTKS